MYKIVHEIPEGFEELERLFPPALPAILGRMLQKDPAERYQSMDAVVEAFEDLSEVLKEERQSRASRRGSAKPGTEKTLQRDRLHEASTIAAGETPCQPPFRRQVHPPGVLHSRRGIETSPAAAPGETWSCRWIARRRHCFGRCSVSSDAIQPAQWHGDTEHPSMGARHRHRTGRSWTGFSSGLPDHAMPFTLAPGTYVLTCANPGFVKTFRVRVVVAQDSLSQVTQTFPGYTIERVLARY